MLTPQSPVSGSSLGTVEISPALLPGAPVRNHILRTVADEIIAERDIQRTLERLRSQGYVFIVHQTDAASAESIVGSSHFSDSGLAWTTLILDVEMISRLIQTLLSRDRGHSVANLPIMPTNDDVDAFVLMAIPRNAGENGNISNLNDVDALLGGMVERGELSKLGAPNHWILGHYGRWDFHVNRQWRGTV